MPHVHDRSAVTVDTLPDEIFLEIFASYLSTHHCPLYCYDWFIDKHTTTAWQRLVHVCRRWRNIIFGSPRYLNLNLHCSNKIPFKRNLGRWPEFPLTLDYFIQEITFPTDDDFDVVVALEHADRVQRVFLDITGPGSESVVVRDMVEAMQVPFPELKTLSFLGPPSENQEFYLPDEFLGGSAPCLQDLTFDGIAFPALPKLLLSARSLVSLDFERTTLASCRDYVSPQALVEGLAGLTKLRTLCLKFKFPEDPPDSEELKKRRRPDLSSLTRALLPALTEFVFRGLSWYSEDLVAQIDAPLVEDVVIEYFSWEVETSQLSQFIGRTTNFKFAQFRRAELNFYFLRNEAFIELDRPQGECSEASFFLTVSPSDEELGHLVPCMTRALGRLTAMLSDVGQLSIHDGEHEEEYRVDNAQWLPLLQFFPVVEELYVTGSGKITLPLLAGAASLVAL